MNSLNVYLNKKKSLNKHVYKNFGTVAPTQNTKIKEKIKAHYPKKLKTSSKEKDLKRRHKQSFKHLKNICEKNQLKILFNFNEFNRS